MLRASPPNTRDENESSSEWLENRWRWRTVPLEKWSVVYLPFLFLLNAIPIIDFVFTKCSVRQSGDFLPLTMHESFGVKRFIPFKTILALRASSNNKPFYRRHNRFFCTYSPIPLLPRLEKKSSEVAQQQSVTNLNSGSECFLFACGTEYSRGCCVPVCSWSNVAQLSFSYVGRLNN